MEQDYKNIQKEEKKGDKCLKTGLFQWSKDFTGAACAYDRVVEQYKNIGKYDDVKKIIN